METPASANPVMEAGAWPPTALGRLPLPLTSLVARERERAAVIALVQRSNVRLLSLTGPGGVGKTRLAIAAATDLAFAFPGGVAFVALASVRDATLVASAIAEALGVRETGDQPVQSRLMNVIGEATMLLVLDNFEHVLAAGALVVALLTSCPHLTILVTSRAALRVSGEYEYPVPPLPLPASDADPQEAVNAPAVRLFAERAVAVAPGFVLSDDNAAAIAAICVRLDGLPLAIELAAARSTVLSPALLLPRLARRLPLLTGGPRDVPARLQTMGDAIAWSHELLTPDEQALFRRLAVFVGGFTLDAAEAISYSLSAISPTEGGALVSTSTVLDLVSALVDKSLLQRTDATATGRLAMLETIREFALEHLEVAGEVERARTAHAAYFAAFDKRLDPNMTAPGERVDDRLWGIDAELANFRAALCFLANAGDAEGVLRLAGSLAIFWHLRGNLSEGRQWLEWALKHTQETATASHARALAGYSLILWSQGHLALAGPPAEAAHRIAQALDHTELTALSVHLLGLVALGERHWEQATSHMTEALALWRSLDLPSDEAMALRVLGWVAYETGDAATCIQSVEASLALFRAVGHPSGVAGALGLFALQVHAQGDDERALGAYHEALQLWSRIDTRWGATRRPGGSSTASTFPRWAGIDDRRLLVLALTGVAAIAADHEQGDQAAALIGAADARRDAVGMPMSPTVLVIHERTRERVRAALGNDRFATHHAAGQTLLLADAVALALAITASEPARETSVPPPSTAPGLTARQVEVLRLIVAGRSDREIAATLFIGHRTAQDHVSHILAKLGVVNRTEAAAIAVRDGLL